MRKLTGLIALITCFSTQAKMPVGLPVASLSAVENVVAKTLREFKIPRGNPIGGFRGGVIPIVGRNKAIGTLGPVVSLLVEMEKEEKWRKEQTRAAQKTVESAIISSIDMDRPVVIFPAIPDWRLCQMPKQKNKDKNWRIHKAYSRSVKVCCVKDYIMKAPDIK